MDFTRLGSVTTNRKNVLTGQQLAVGTDSRSVSTGPSRMFSALTEGCHMGYSRKFVGTVYYTYGQSKYDHWFHDDVINVNIFRVTGPLCGNSPVTDVCFDLCLNKQLSKRSWGWWFETPPRSLWRHYDVIVMLMSKGFSCIRLRLILYKCPHLYL